MRVAPTRSRPECAASERTPNDPEMMPAASLSAVMQVAASIELSATRRLRVEVSAGVSAEGLVGGEIHRVPRVQGAYGGVQPGDAEGVGLPFAFGVACIVHTFGAVRREEGMRRRMTANSYMDRSCRR